MTPKARTDLLGGLLLVCIGITAMYLARNYQMGTADNMGPGYFPMVLSGILIVFGIVIACGGSRDPRPAPMRPAWRPLLIVVGSVLMFSFLVGPLGFALTAFLMVLVSRTAGNQMRWRESLMLAAALSALSTGIFYFGLGLSLNLLPRGF